MIRSAIAYDEKLTTIKVILINFLMVDMYY